MFQPIRCSSLFYVSFHVLIRVSRLVSLLINLIYRRVFVLQFSVVYAHCCCSDAAVASF